MTAVEWLMDKYVDKNGSISYKDLQQAKEIEKQQIINSVHWGSLYSDSNKTAEQYYNETFKKQ